MSPAVFVERNGSLSPMLTDAYAKEDELQALLEQYPELLLGEEQEDGSLRRYLLLKREAGVPDESQGADRWSIDHLFVDAEGILTFVEVKRKSDTRIRREVVGQMLEYAANARRFWPAARLRAEFVAAGRGEDELRALVGPDVDLDEFWRDVQTNLDAARIRLIFVADEIPDELKTIVEFLNEQLGKTEVLAVEVRRYKGDGLTTLVSSTIGDTAKAQEAKGGSPRRAWTRSEVLDEMESGLGSQVRAEVEKLLAWAELRKIGVRQGTGQTGALLLVLPGRDRGFFTLYSDGRIFFDQVRHYMRHAPFDDDATKSELIRKLDALKPGAHAVRDENRVSGFPLAISVKDLLTPQVQDNLKQLLEWVLDVTPVNALEPHDETARKT